LKKHKKGEIKTPVLDLETLLIIVRPRGIKRVFQKSQLINTKGEMKNEQ